MTQNNPISRDFNESDVCPKHNCEVVRMPFEDGNSISESYVCPDCELNPREAENKLNKMFSFPYKQVLIEEAVAHEKGNNFQAMMVLTERLEKIAKYIQTAERNKLIKTINEMKY